MATKRRHDNNDRTDDYEVVGVSSGRRPGGVVSVRLNPDELELLAALSRVGDRTLSETLRLGLRCLGLQPGLAAGPTAQTPRLDTRASALVLENTAEPVEWSQPNQTRASFAR